MAKVLKELEAVKGKFCIEFRTELSVCVSVLLTECVVPAEKAKLEKTHATALKRAEDEVVTLRDQLAEITDSHKVEMEQAASEKTRLEEEVQQLRQEAETSQKNAELAQEAARQFQARIDAWTVEFKKVQDNMHGEFIF